MPIAEIRFKIQELIKDCEEAIENAHDNGDMVVLPYYQGKLWAFKQSLELINN